jgi:N-methylhydantoinase B
LSGGKPGSLNSAKVIRNDGTVETFDMCTRVRVGKGELIRLTTATGGGFGDPAQRPRDLVMRDLKNGFINARQAQSDYGLDAG